MRFLAAIAVCGVLSGCADTVVTENGQQVLRIGSNAVNVNLRTANGTTFHADVIDNGSVIQAQGQAVSGVVTSVSAGVVGGMVALHNPVPAVVATAIPPVVTQAQGVVRPTNINISNQWIDPATGTRVTVTHKAKHRHRKHRANDSPPKD